MSFTEELKAERARLVAMLDPHAEARIKSDARAYAAAVGQAPPELLEVLQRLARTQADIAKRIATIDDFLDAPATAARLAAELRQLDARRNIASEPSAATEPADTVHRFRETAALYVQARSRAAHVRLKDSMPVIEPVLAELLAIRCLTGQPDDGGVYHLTVDPLAIETAKMGIAAEIKGANLSAFHAPRPGALVN